MKKLFLLLGILPLFLHSYSQSVINAVKVEKPPRIDGIVAEEVWEKASMVDEFYQREPREGAPVSLRTEFLVCYDSDFIYFGIKCWDNPEDITAKELARDVSLSNDDRIQIILDTYMDNRNAYWFQIGPRGSIGDALVSENGAAFNKQWDGLWTGKARITDYGWEAEASIPFKTLGFNKENDEWGIKFIRHIVDNLESSYWPEANLNTHRFQVSDAGTLKGIENITQGIGLDISPYLVTGFDSKYNQDIDPKLTGGVDIFYQITPSLKSSLTINTDFAETEVDDRQINLTRFNLHFPEKRDFFLDGANYFQFGIEGDRRSPVSKRIIPFFSRRMGLDENGKPIPINVGGKLTGQINKWNIGVMHINDDRSVGFNNYTVARVSRNIWKQSSVGIIGTHGNAIGLNENYLYGADVNLSTSTFQKNKNASLIFFGLHSETTDTKGDNNAWGAQFVYPNDLFKARLGFHQIGKNFIAGMGFVPRTNMEETYGEFTFGPRPDKLGIMQFLIGVEFDFIQNHETQKAETHEISFRPLGFRFKSGEELNYRFSNRQEWLYNDFNIFRDFIIPQGAHNWWLHEIELETKGARNLWGEANYRFGDFFNGQRNDIGIQANWKVAVPFFIGGTLNRNHIMLPAGDFTATIYQLNANILFSPDITLYNFVQYDNASELIGWQSRFQWILKPGNEIILAWTAGFEKNNSIFIMEEGTARIKLKYNIRF